jgi:uncharacterized protein
VSTADEVRIGPNTLLPGRREPITLTTADGLRLIGELARPVDRAPRATLVLLHPLPTDRGMMDSHLYRKAAWRLPALADLAVLRFNTRGTASEAGRSEGSFDGGNAERYDVAAALEYAEFEDMPNVWLVGWSFGSELTLMHGCDPLVRGAVLISPPLKRAGEDDLAVWAESGKPVVCLVPEFDDYLRPAEARERMPRFEVVGIPGAKHLWVGDAETVLDEVVKRVAPETPVPLPREWDGPMESGDASAYSDRTVAAFADVPVAGPVQRKARG